METKCVSFSDEVVDESSISIECNGTQISVALFFDREQHPWYCMAGSCYLEETPYIRPFLKDFLYEQNKECEEIINGIKSDVEKIGNTLAKKAKEKQIPYNVKIDGEYTHTIEKEVPVEKKVGLFKKETVMELRQETVSEQLTTEFDGWLIKRFTREFYVTENFIKSKWETLNWDYCLGKDGNYYVLIWLKDKDNTYKYRVFDLIPMPMLIIDANQFSKKQFKMIAAGTLAAFEAGECSQPFEIPGSIDGEDYSFNFNWDYVAPQQNVLDILFETTDNAIFNNH